MDEKLREQYEEIAAMIESEGLAYAITEGYLSETSTDNPELAQAFKDAEKALKTIERIMRPYMY